jgi:carbamoyltransferase
MRIIGIYDGHNASVSLLENGKIVFAVQEERLTNQKNYFGFPKKSLNFLMDYYELKPKDIDLVVFGCEYMSPPMTREEFFDHFSKQGSLLMTFLKKVSKFPFVKKLRTEKNKKRRIDLVKKFGFPEEKIKFIDHHLCHASSAYFGLAKDWNKKYLVLTLDGGGDWLCSTVNIGFQGKIEKIAETSYGNSLGDKQPL